MNLQNQHILPEGWVRGLFKDLAIIEMGQSPEGDTYNSIGVGIALLNGPTEFTNRYPIRVQWTSKPTKVCKTGDILICVRGSSTGRINISDDEYCIGRGVAAVRANKNSDTLFLEYQLTFVVQQILKLSAGSTFPNIDKNSLSKINVDIPPLPEQRQIAAVLGIWDRAIEQTTELLKELRTRHRGLMHQLLTGVKRLSGFNGEWKHIELNEVFERVKRRNSEGNTNVLTISAQQGLIGQGRYFNKNIASEDVANYFLLHRGEFAYNKSYSTGYPMGAIKRLDQYDKGILSPLYIIQVASL